MGVERERVSGFGRLDDGLRHAGDWYLWGPYVSERQWGTVREDYRADGEAWTSFPHDHARSRAYRWGEDLCRENRRRSREEPEYELLDTGAFDGDRYWIVEVAYAKAEPGDVLMSVRVTNAGPDRETVHVLPTAWFRNTWSWAADDPRPGMAATTTGAVAVDHPMLGGLELLAGPGPGGVPATLLFCKNETNAERLYGVASTTPYPKDGINDHHVLAGAATVDPAQRGTKCAFWHRLTVAPGSTAAVRLRLRPAGSPEPPVLALGAGFDDVIARRRPRPTSSTPS